MLTDNLRSELMLIAGCLHDISEKTVDYNAHKQLNVVLGKLYVALKIQDGQTPEYLKRKMVTTEVVY